LIMRKVALALIKRGDKYLVEKFYDEVDKVYFYKLIGGAIEEGETPKEALSREFMEELKSKICEIKNFAVILDKVKYNGTDREIEAHILEANFEDEYDSRFTQKFIYSLEGKFLSIAMWKSLDEIKSENLILYPRSLIELLK